MVLFRKDFRLIILNIYILSVEILIRSFSAFYFSKTEIEKSHVDVVSVSNLKMAINFVTVPQTAALIKMAFVSNLKSQVRFFQKKNYLIRSFGCKDQGCSPYEISKALFLDTRWYTANGFLLHSLNSNRYSLYSRYNIDHDSWSMRCKPLQVNWLWIL